MLKFFGSMKSQWKKGGVFLVLLFGILPQGGSRAQTQIPGTGRTGLAKHCRGRYRS